MNRKILLLFRVIKKRKAVLVRILKQDINNLQMTVGGLLQENHIMDQINNAQTAFQMLKTHFNPDCEEFWLITLNTQLCILNTTLLSRGTLNFCLVHPRDLFRKAILDNAFQTLIAHNHPSLCVKPTEADIVLTKRLKKISKLIEIPIIDHIIFSNHDYFSFKENKLIF